MMYKLGILGGMGPGATCDLYNRIIKHTKASCDQDHIRMVILNNCDTPDRTKALLEGGKSPLPYLNDGIKTLIDLGCEYFIIPCNTAHAYASKFRTKGKINFISMIEEVHKELEEKYKGKKVCVLCTNGTRSAKVYEKEGVSIYYPTLQDQVMSVVTNTKAGLDALSDLQDVINKEEDNFDIFLLACTELSLYKDKLTTKKTIIDAMDILVKATIIKCCKKYVD